MILLFLFIINLLKILLLYQLYSTFLIGVDIFHLTFTQFFVILVSITIWNIKITYKGTNNVSK